MLPEVRFPSPSRDSYMSESHVSITYAVEVPPLTLALLDIVHGDVKCENILIFEKDESKSRSRNDSGYPA